MFRYQTPFPALWISRWFERGWIRVKSFWMLIVWGTVAVANGLCRCAGRWEMSASPAGGPRQLASQSSAWKSSGGYSIQRFHGNHEAGDQSEHRRFSPRRHRDRDERPWFAQPTTWWLTAFAGMASVLILAFWQLMHLWPCRTTIVNHVTQPAAVASQSLPPVQEEPRVAPEPQRKTPWWPSVPSTPPPDEGFVTTPPFDPRPSEEPDPYSLPPQHEPYNSLPEPEWDMEFARGPVEDNREFLVDSMRDASFPLRPVGNDADDWRRFLIVGKSNQEEFTDYLDSLPREQRIALERQRLTRGDQITTTSADTTDQVDVSIAKALPETATSGEPMTYRILVRNEGLRQVSHVDVDDNVPPAYRVIEVDPPAAFVDHMLQWRLNDLRPRETRELSVTVIPSQEGEIETSTTSTMATAVETSTTIAEEIALDLSVVLPKQIRTGDACPMQFRVTNRSSSEVDDVVLRAVLPKELEHAKGEAVEYKIGNLRGGESKDVRLAPTAVSTGRALHKTEVLVSDRVVETSTDPISVYDPPLVLRRWGAREAQVGQSSLFTNYVKNTSRDEVTRVEIVESVPAGLEVVRVHNAGQFDSRTRTIRWTVDRMRSGETAKLGVTLRPRLTGDIHSRIEGTTANGAAVPIDAHVKVRDESRRPGPTATRERASLPVKRRKVLPLCYCCVCGPC